LTNYFKYAFLNNKLVKKQYLQNKKVTTKRLFQKSYWVFYFWWYYAKSLNMKIKYIQKSFSFLWLKNENNIKALTLTTQPYQKIRFLEIFFRIHNMFTIVSNLRKKKKIFVKTPKNNFLDPQTTNFNKTRRVHSDRRDPKKPTLYFYMLKFTWKKITDMIYIFQYTTL
jgi:hypothetical protein